LTYTNSLSIGKKVTLIMALVLLAGFFILKAYLLFSFGKKIEVDLGQRLKSIVSSGVIAISADDHKKILNDYLKRKKNIDQTPHFKRTQNILKQIRKRNNLSTDVYTLVNPKWAKDKMIFIAMDSDKNYTGNVLKLNMYAERAFNKGTSEFTLPYKDKEGEWISAFAPIKDKDNNVVGLLEIDYRVDIELKAAQLDLFKQIMVPTVVVLILTVFVGHFLGRSISHPILKLRNMAKAVREGDYSIRAEVKSRDEVGQLGGQFNSMLDEINQNRAELADYSKNLEEKVEVRTEELSKANQLLKSILDSLGQGLLVFNKSGDFLPIYSRPSVEIFNTSLEGKKVWEVLNEKNDQTIQDWVELLFQEALPFEQLSALGPKNQAHQEGRKIELEYFQMKGLEGQLEGIIVVATDKTERHKAMLAVKKEEDFGRILLRALNLKNNFTVFSKEILANISIVENLMMNEEKIDDVKRALHTLKGGLSSFKMDELSKEIHIIEGDFNLGQLMNVAKAFKETSSKITAQLHSLGEMIDQNIEDGEKRVLYLDDLISFLADIKDESLKESFSKRFILSEIESLMDPYSDLVADLAQEGSLSVAPLSLVNGQYRVYAPVYHRLLSSLVHAFRNAIDHGIETADERESIGKKGMANIEVIFNKVRNDSERGELLEILIKDDGRGIDVTVLREKLKSKGVEISEQLSDHQVLQYIFYDGFSSREKVTETSGRGVGMSAISFEVDKLKGVIEVFSEKGVGTKLAIRIPFVDSVSSLDLDKVA
jgi:two-component system, chemotaxis family, sensor kinase CheA